MLFHGACDPDVHIVSEDPATSSSTRRGDPVHREGCPVGLQCLHMETEVHRGRCYPWGGIWHICPGIWGCLLGVGVLLALLGGNHWCRSTGLTCSWISVRGGERVHQFLWSVSLLSVSLFSCSRLPVPLSVSELLVPSLPSVLMPNLTAHPHRLGVSEPAVAVGAAARPCALSLPLLPPAGPSLWFLVGLWMCPGQA